MKRTLPLVLIAMLMPAAPALAADYETTRHKLKSTRTFDGVPCVRYAWTFEDGKLHSCFLAEPMEIAGHRLPEGTHAHFDPEGRLEMCFLGKDTRLEGQVCRGHGHGYMTTFHPNGRLRLCWLKQAGEIQGVPCQRATFLTDLIGASSGVYFHDNGQLKGCEVSRVFTMEGRSFAKGDRVQLKADGTLPGR